MKRRASGRRPILALVLAALTGGCSKVETKRLLPWFETRTRQTRTLGPVSVGSNGTTPYVRRFGLFWTEVSGCLDGEVLDADTVAVSCSDRFNRGTDLLRRGETEARPACGTYASFAQILPDRSAVDCALFNVEGGALTLVAAAPELRRAECAEAPLWSQRAGRSLRIR